MKKNISLKRARAFHVNPCLYLKDIRAAIDDIHVTSLKLKTTCLASPEQYIKRDDRLAGLLERLRTSEKKTFLLTNSDWWYSNQVMTFLLGPGWVSHFSVVVVDACKPSFFSSSREMRRLEAGDTVYSGGDHAKLTALLGCRGDDIIYWGDHLYADIVQCRRLSPWRTALVVPELDWSHISSPSSTNIFRCREDVTYFTSNMEKYADIYTGSVCNLLNYKVDHVFTPSQTVLQHEYKPTF